MEGCHAEAPVSLTLTEQMALYFSKGLFKPLQGTPIHESLESALQKIGSELPPQSFQFLRGLDQAISVRTLGFKNYTLSKDVIAALTHSTFHKFTTRIHHRAARFKKGIDREVDPYRLWYVNNGIYLVGHDHHSDEKRRDGSIILTLQVANLWEVQRWLIGFGSDALVLEPRELKQQIERECANLLRRRTKPLPI